MRKASRRNPITIPTAWDLAENAAMRVSRRDAPVVVSVERGTILVTRRGDLQDHVLEAGDELFLPRGGLAVAWALTGATLSVREAASMAEVPLAG